MQNTSDIVREWKNTRIGVDILIDEFIEAEELISRHEAECYDLIIMDIRLDSSNGIDIVKNFRARGDSTMVIYTSQYTDYAMDAFEIFALGYVEKPVSYNKMKPVLDRAGLLYQTRRREYIAIHTKPGMTKVETQDIVCVENNNRSVTYTICDGRKLKVSRRAGTFEGMIEPLPHEAGFVQTHKSFFVNMKYIRNIGDELCILDNGMEIPVARRRRSIFRARYMEYTMELGRCP